MEADGGERVRLELLTGGGPAAGARYMAGGRLADRAALLDGRAADFAAALERGLGAPASAPVHVASQVMRAIASFHKPAWASLARAALRGVGQLCLVAPLWVSGRTTVESWASRCQRAAPSAPPRACLVAPLWAWASPCWRGAPSAAGAAPRRAQEEALYVGRVVSDGAARLDAGGLQLEGSLAASQGHRVRLDLSQLPDFRVFPGQARPAPALAQAGGCQALRRGGAQHGARPAADGQPPGLAEHALAWLATGPELIAQAYGILSAPGPQLRCPFLRPGARLIHTRHAPARCMHTHVGAA